ncbi:MAG TPA: hypothetical protein VFO37_06550 [Chitinophagaceae bacterium]|nr:hypothetical protein [Chitinophagaceae bacterium]
MEVHAHTHIPTGREKKWTHYFWEFLMLFLAVFCGFLAEYQLEHKIERDREKQFIASMIKELEADTVQVNRVLNDTLRVKAFDTLMNLIYAGNINSIDTRKLYYLKRNYVGRMVAMDFSRNTLTQLKNGGNMRLIRNRDVVDSLNRLDNLVSATEDQLSYYRQYSYNNTEFATQIFNEGYFRENGKYMGAAYILNGPVQPKLVTDDYRLLIEFANRLANQTGVLYNYHGLLKYYKNYSTRLITFLKEKYHLK